MIKSFSFRERLGVAVATGIVFLLGLGGWTFAHAGGDAAPPPVAPVGANGTPAALEVAATGAAAPAPAAAGTPADPASPAPTAASSAQATSAVIMVHVAGNVKNPGVYKFKLGDRICDAVHAAGGFQPWADQDALNLADTLRDADQIYVPKKEAAVAATAAAASTVSSDADAPPVRRSRRALVVSGTAPAALAAAARTPAARTSAAQSATAEDSADSAPAAPLADAPTRGRIIGKPADAEADAVAANTPGTASDDPTTSASDAVVAPAPAGKSYGKTKSRGKSGARTGSTRSSGGKTAKFKNPGDGVVHLNSATAAQIEKLPGVGPAIPYKTRISC